MRRAFALALVMMWQTQSHAALNCSALFVRPSATETSFSKLDLNDQFADLKAFNFKVKALNFLTGGVQERATNEALKVTLGDVKFNIENKLPFEILKDHEGLAVDLAISYAYIKLPETRVLFLREEVKREAVNRAEKAKLAAYKVELAELEALRKKHLVRIGRRFIQYRAIVSTLESYKTDSSNMERAERADFVLNRLGVDKTTLRHVPLLTAYVDKLSPGGVQSVLRPSVKDLNALFSAKDPNLSPEETLIAKNAKLNRDIRVQVISNQIRRISLIAGDQFLTKYTTGLLKKMLTKLKSSEGTDEMVSRVGNELHNVGIVTSQYGSVDHLRDNLKSPRERYLYFLAMLARFGPSGTPGVDEFMLTLAKRVDAIPVWEDIKRYIREEGARYEAQEKGEMKPVERPADAVVAEAAGPVEVASPESIEKPVEGVPFSSGEVRARIENPNIVLAPDLTLLQAMEKAETARASGWLPSTLNPYRQVSFAFVKSAGTLSIAAVLSELLYAYIMGSDDDSKKDKRGLKPELPTAVAAPKPQVTAPPAAVSAAAPSNLATSQTATAPSQAAAAKSDIAVAPSGVVTTDGKFEIVERELARLSVMNKDVLLAVLKKAAETPEPALGK